VVVVGGVRGVGKDAGGLLRRMFRGGTSSVLYVVVVGVGWCVGAS